MRHYITTLLLLLTLGVAPGVNTANAVALTQNAVFTKTQAKRKAAGEYSDDVAKKLARKRVRLKAQRRKILRTGAGQDVRPMQIVREIKHGETLTDIVQEGKQLTFASDVEHAVVTLKDGRRVLVSGGKHGIELTKDVKRVIGHTHPYSLPPSGPSTGDLNALRELKQRNSYLLERGELQKFGNTAE